MQSAHLRRAERGALHRAAGSRRRASGIVRDDGRHVMSISAAARGAVDLRGRLPQKRLAHDSVLPVVGWESTCRLVCGVYLVLIAAIKRSNE